MDALTAAAAASAVPSSSLGLASSASNKGKGNGMSVAEELTLTKLIEYSVLLLNQVSVVLLVSTACSGSLNLAFYCCYYYCLGVLGCEDGY